MQISNYYNNVTGPLCRQLQKRNIFVGTPFTSEAALTKLSYVLSKKDWDQNQKRRAMDTSIRGEMTLQFGSSSSAILEIQNEMSDRLELSEQVKTPKSN